MTVSERLFERFCVRRGISFTRLVEGATKTPDYEIVADGLSIAVEVKQLEPNAEDLAILAEAAEKKRAGYWIDMSRPRQSILDAVKQLRVQAKGRQPAMVVLYEVVGLLGYLDSDSIGQCLYGPEQIHLAVPKDATREPWVLGGSHGGGRVATKRHNTTLSAVAVLQADGPSDTICVYHNAFAALPIEPHRFRFEGVRHFAWRAPQPERLPCWVDVTSTAA